MLFPVQVSLPALGDSSLIVIILLGNVYLMLCPDGMERRITYPLIVWVIGTGAYLMASVEKKDLKLLLFECHALIGQHSILDRVGAKACPVPNFQDAVFHVN